MYQEFSACDEDDACPANSYCTDVADPAEEGAFLAEWLVHNDQVFFCRFDT